MGVQNALAIAEVRQDLRFTVDYGMGRQNQEYSYLYNLTDLLVQVRWYQDGEWYSRFGILVDFEDSARYGEQTYILEIPTKETDPKKIAESQISKIKDYITEMRAQWRTLLDHVRQDDQPMLIGYWDKLHKWLDSADGRWDLLRAFQNNTMPGSMPANSESRAHAEPKSTPSKYKSFFHWLVAKEPALGELQRRELSSVDDATPDLQRLWMPLLCGREYDIYLDWAIPYVCYAEKWKVSHFKTEGHAEFLYYPFHDFEYQGLPGTRYTPPTARSRPDVVVKLRPTNYAPFAYWGYLIDRIDQHKAEAHELLAPYYTYATNLGLIEAIFANHGPLRDLSQEEIAELTCRAAKDHPDWSGNVGDIDWSGEEAHCGHIALGMRDIIEAKELFLGIIKSEAITGRTSNLRVRVEADASELMKAVSSAPSEKLYEDLWAHNRDAYGFDAFFEKAHLLISQSGSADAAYDRYVRAHVYEHEVLNDPAASRESPPDGAFWAGSAYRTTSLLLGMWSMYYAVREKRLDASVRKTSMSASEIAEWFRQSTPGLTREGKGMTWWLHDQGQRKLANYLLKGGKLEKLQEMEADIVRGIGEVVGKGKPTTGPFTQAQIDEIRDVVIKTKYEKLLREGGLDPGQPTRALSPIHIMLNTYLLVCAVGAAEEAKWSTETVYGVFAATVSLASDGLSYMVFRLWKVQGALTRAAYVSAGGVASSGAMRGALAAGRLELFGGKAGGVLGVAWFAYSSVADYRDGRRKDAVLDAISGVGVALTMVGTILAPTIVGTVPGLILDIVGVGMILVAQLVKAFSLWENKYEVYVESLYKGELDGSPAGCQRLEHWFEEEEMAKVRWDWGEYSIDRVRSLTKRLDRFLVDMDTFDHFQSKAN